MLDRRRRPRETRAQSRAAVRRSFSRGSGRHVSEPAMAPPDRGTRACVVTNVFPTPVARFGSLVTLDSVLESAVFRALAAVTIARIVSSPPSAVRCRGFYNVPFLQCLRRLDEDARRVPLFATLCVCARRHSAWTRAPTTRRTRRSRGARDTPRQRRRGRVATIARHLARRACRSRIAFSLLRCSKL